jgi:transcriptional regulator with XRE-family HTH domain
VVARPSPTVQRRRLGIELRRERERAGLTIDQVAAALECSDSKVSRIETGQVSATPRDVRDMLELYKVDPEQRDALIQVAREARQKGWWQAYSDTPVVPLVGLEAAADRIHQYAAMAVPGLLQTREYSLAMLRVGRPDLSPQRIERWVELRMARQVILSHDDPPAFSVVLEESVLRRPVGGSTAMREQVRHLARTAVQSTVTLQILPLTVGAHAGMSGTFTIYGFSAPTDSDVVYLEHARGDLYLESEEEIRAYSLTFARLSASALSRDESAEFLTKLAGEL